MASQVLHILIVSGLDDGKYNTLNLLSKWWGAKGVELHSCPVGWKDGAPYERKLKRLLDQIDQYAQKGNVALVGTSAGGSLVINAFARRPGVVAAVSVCGRLQAGRNVRPTLEQAARASEAFKQSVLACEESQRGLPVALRRHVLVLRPWRDEVVPPVTMRLDGAREVRVAGIEHTISIVTALIFYRKTIATSLPDSLIIRCDYCKMPWLLTISLDRSSHHDRQRFAARRRGSRRHTGRTPPRRLQPMP